MKEYPITRTYCDKSHIRAKKDYEVTAILKCSKFSEKSKDYIAHGFFSRNQPKFLINHQNFVHQTFFTQTFTVTILSLYGIFPYMVYELHVVLLTNGLRGSCPPAPPPPPLPLKIKIK